MRACPISFGGTEVVSGLAPTIGVYPRTAMSGAKSVPVTLVLSVDGDPVKDRLRLLNLLEGATFTIAGHELTNMQILPPVSEIIRNAAGSGSGSVEAKFRYYFRLQATIVEVKQAGGYDIAFNIPKIPTPNSIIEAGFNSAEPAQVILVACYGNNYDVLKELGVPSGSGRLSTDVDFQSDINVIRDFWKKDRTNTRKVIVIAVTTPELEYLHSNDQVPVEDPSGVSAVYRQADLKMVQIHEHLTFGGRNRAGPYIIKEKFQAAFPGLSIAGLDIMGHGGGNGSGIVFPPSVSLDPSVLGVNIRNAVAGDIIENVAPILGDHAVVNMLGCLTASPTVGARGTMTGRDDIEVSMRQTVASVTLTGFEHYAISGGRRAINFLVPKPQQDGTPTRWIKYDRPTAGSAYVGPEAVANYPSLFPDQP